MYLCSLLKAAVQLDQTVYQCPLWIHKRLRLLNFVFQFLSGANTKGGAGLGFAGNVSKIPIFSGGNAQVFCYSSDRGGSVLFS